MPVVESDASGDAEARIRRLHRGARILLAEDNAVNQEVLLAVLHGVDLDVDVAANGQEAVALAGSHTYSLVLMDMQMPVMGGLEATHKIRALPGWQNTPIIALTANVFDEDRQACREAGMDDFISKPVEVQTLYESMLSWLDRSSSSSQ